MQPKLITFWLEEQSWNSLRMLKSLEMKNVSHNKNYLLRYSRFKLPQRSHVLLLQKRKLWRLHEPQLQAEYRNFIKERPADVKPGSVEDARNKLKDCLLRGVDKVYGKIKGGWVRHNKTWWWNDEANDAVKEKRKK